MQVAIPGTYRWPPPFSSLALYTLSDNSLVWNLAVGSASNQCIGQPLPTPLSEFQMEVSRVLAREAAILDPRGLVPRSQLLARERYPSPLFCSRLAQLACIDTGLRCMNVPGYRLSSLPVSLRHDKSGNGMWLPHLLSCRPGSLTACANPAALARARGVIALLACTRAGAAPALLTRVRSPAVLCSNGPARAR